MSRRVSRYAILVSVAVRLEEFSPGYLGSAALTRLDYADAFSASVSPGTDCEPVRLVRAFFYASPAWLNWLMHVRARVAQLMGLKHPPREAVLRELAEFTGAAGQSVALFDVMDRTEEGIVTGQDDSHLNFRLAFLRVAGAGETRITLATAVELNGWAGKFYFLPVRMLHRWIVPALLRRMVTLLAMPEANWPKL